MRRAATVFTVVLLFSVTAAQAGDPPTVISVNIPPPVPEGASAAVVTLVRSGNLSVASHLYYSLSFGLPGAPPYGVTDRLASSQGDVYFAAGETQKELSFPLRNADAVWTGPTVYYLYVRSLDATLLQGSAAQIVVGTIEIADDEPQPRVVLDDVVVAEGAGAATVGIRATLDIVAAVGLYVYLEPATNAHVIVAQGASIPAGTTSANARISFKGNAQAEPDRTYSVRFELRTASGAVQQGTINFTILNDDINAEPSDVWMNTGESLTLPLALGTPLTSDASLIGAADPPSNVALTPSVDVGASNGSLKIDALRVGDTTVVLRVDSPQRHSNGMLRVHILQISALIADPTSVQLRVGQELPLRVSFAPGQPAAAPITVQSQNDGIVSVVTPTASAPVGGDAVFKLRGISPGKTTLVIYSLTTGQPSSTSVAVEVLAATSRRRATRP